MQNNPKIILVNFGCKSFSFEQILVFTEVMPNPAEQDTIL